jgi:endonuclease YncB( thermonuclease family)
MLKKQNRSVCPSEFSGRCVAVHDGDSISILYGESVIEIRLAGIDAPEGSQPFGNKSKQYAISRVFGKMVKVFTNGTDKYDRTLGWIFLGDKCLNKEMVANGYAWWFQKQAPTNQELAKLEQVARNRKYGLWANASAPAP